MKEFEIKIDPKELMLIEDSASVLVLERIKVIPLSNMIEFYGVRYDLSSDGMLNKAEGEAVLQYTLSLNNWSIY